MQLVKETIHLPTIFGVTEEAEQRRNDLVFAAAHHRTVTDSAGQNSAVESARDIRKHLSEVEATRKAIKRPLIDAGRLIDALADEHTAPLAAELYRLEQLVTDFQSMEARRVAAEQEARRVEAEKVMLAERKAYQEARQAALAMQSESDLAKAIEAEAEAKAKAEAAQVALSAPQPVAAKSGGASTRQVVEWECLDVHALYKARPELCRLEPNRAAINATCFPEMPVPGLSIWWKNKTTIRTW